MALLSDYINNQKPKTQQAETAAAPSNGLLSSFVEKSGVQPAKKTAAPMLTALEQRQPRSSVPLVQAPNATKTLTPLERIQQGVGQKTEFKPITPPGGIPKIDNGLDKTEQFAYDVAKTITPKDASSWGGFMPYNIARGLQGAAGAVEGVVDFAVGNLNTAASLITSLGGTNPNAVSKWFDEGARYVYDNDISGAFGKGIDDTAQNRNKLGDIAGSIYQGAGQILTTAGAGKAVSGVSNLSQAAASKLALGASAGGTSAQQAYKEGATPLQAAGYGNVAGALETAIEGISGGVSVYGKGLTDKVLAKFAGTPAALTRIVDILGEGGEEALSTAITPYIQRIMYNPAAENATLEQMKQDFITGAAISAVMQGAEVAGNMGGKAKNTQQNTQAPTSPLNAPVSADTTSMGVDTAKTQDVAQRATEGAETANSVNTATKPYGIFPEWSPGAQLQAGNSNLPKGTGAAEQGFVPTTEYDTWSQNTENGKFHDVGENAVRSVDLPKVNPQGENTMKTAATVMESQNTPDARVREIQQALVDGDMGYIPIANEKLAAQADAKVKRNGWQTSLTDWTAQVRSGKVKPQLMAEGAILLNNAANAPECTKEAYINLLTDYANLNHASGQALQAARILKKLSPEGKLYAMQRSVQALNEDVQKSSGKKNKTVDIKLDADLADKYRKATTDAERDAIVSEIQQDIADQLPSTGLDKWTALRYVNMLGNFKTQIRNVAGNTTMLAVTKIKNEVAAALELIANKASGGKFERTKSFTNGKGLYRAAYADFENVQSAAMGEGKYSQSNAKSEFEKGIEEKKTIFKANGDWGKTADSNIAAKGARAATDVGFKVLEAYRNITNRAMEQGDVIFSRVTYADALAGYLKVHAVSAQQLTNGQVDTALLDRARLFAIKEAQEATFRDTNAFSSAVSNFDRGWSKGGQVLSKGIMPFRKTPANIAVRAEEYSPLGAINTAVKAVQLAKGAENVSGADVINSLSKTLTGSGIMMLGWALAKSGLLRGKEDDEKQKAFDQLTGQQDYSITIGGVSFTLDWLTPASMPLFVGAALYDLTAENGIKPNDIESALTSIADPIISMSMLSGVNDALSNIKYSDNNLMQFVLSSAMNYLTQGVTNTLLGQVERTVEENRMATYIDEKSGFPQWLQRGIGKASAKTPGLEYNQGEYVDAWGRTQNNGSLAEKIGINFLSPAYISKPKETALVNELERLYDATGNSSVVPKRMTDREFDTYNGTYTMTVQEQVAFQKTRGQYAFKELSALTESADYKAMSDEDKAKAVAAVQEQATLAAKQSIVEARGGMFIPSATANDKISEYTAAGISKKQAYDLYKTVSQISTTDSAEKKYETIKAIGQQGYTDKQAIAVAATLYTTHDEDTGEVNKQSMLPYLATSKHLLSLYLNTKDSEMVSMTVPVSFSDKKVEYVLTATEKELFQFAYAKEFNAWTNNLSTAEDVKKYRDKAYGFAKSVIIQYRQSGG